MLIHLIKDIGIFENGSFIINKKLVTRRGINLELNKNANFIEEEDIEVEWQYVDINI